MATSRFRLAPARPASLSTNSTDHLRGEVKADGFYFGGMYIWLPRNYEVAKTKEKEDGKRNKRELKQNCRQKRKQMDHSIDLRKTQLKLGCLTRILTRSPGYFQSSQYHICQSLPSSTTLPHEGRQSFSPSYRPSNILLFLSLHIFHHAYIQGFRLPFSFHASALTLLLRPAISPPPR
jgi:hypothetical protein